MVAIRSLGLVDRTRVSALGLVLSTLVVWAVSAAPAAPAAQGSPPSDTADATYMADAQVRAIQPAGGRIWIGGAFGRLLTPSGGSGPAAPGIAALDPVTGVPAGGVSLPALRGVGRFVYDFALSGNVLYAAGTFTYRSGRTTYKNLVGLDAHTGAIVARFNAPSLRCVWATRSRILAGGSRLSAYRPGGARIASFHELVPKIDVSLRGHNTPSLIRDIEVSGATAFAVGQFDFINGRPKKVAVKFDPGTGNVNGWKVGGIVQQSAAFGIQLEVSGSRLYVAAGGSDFTAAYSVADGRQYWKTDTSGSTQTVVSWTARTLVIGGHFQWVEFRGSGTCGDNKHPNTKCLHQPRLAILDASTGHVGTRWRPGICCFYNGVWKLAVHSGRLHVGGQFTRAGGRSQKFYARFS
jgi:hypothetical protein